MTKQDFNSWLQEHEKYWEYNQCAQYAVRQVATALYGELMKETEQQQRTINDLRDVLLRFANIEADNGDDFEGVHEDVIIRVECTAGDLHAARDAVRSHGMNRLQEQGESDD